MKKIITLFMMGLITILSPLTLKANTYSIDQPVIDLNNHTLNEVFTTTKKDLTDYEITSLIDTPVYEGLSLRDIFEDTSLFDTYQLVSNGDFSDGTTGWSDSGTITKNVTDGIIEIISGTNNSGIYQVLNINGIKLYHIIRYKSSTAPFLTISTPYQEFNYPIATDYAVYSSIFNITANTNFNFILRNRLSTEVLYIDYVYPFNISALITIKQYSPLYSTTFDLMSDAQIKEQMDYWVEHKEQFIDYSVFTTAPTQTQLDEWLAVYLDPTSFTGYNDIDPFIFYTAPDGTIFNVTEMINDQVYSPLNDDTFNNLSQSQIENQFSTWETLGLTAQTVLSYTDFLTFAPALSVDDMNYWYNYYNLILEYDEVQAGILSDLEITILVIALVLFIIGIALAIYFKHKFMFFVTGLLWFVPIVIVPNIFIITFSVIMIIIFGLLSFYNSQERDFD